MIIYLQIIYSQMPETKQDSPEVTASTESISKECEYTTSKEVFNGKNYFFCLHRVIHKR